MSSNTYSQFNTDPFYEAKNKIQTSVQDFTFNADKWNNLLLNTNTYNNNEFKRITLLLKNQHKQISQSIKQIQKTINHVKDNPDNFTHIHSTEIDDRQKFINDMTKVIDDIKKQMKSDETKQIITQHKRQYEESKIETASERASRVQNQDFINNQLNEQQQQIAMQDEYLDDILLSLKRLGVKADTMNIEFKDQERLLGDVEQEMDTTQSKLKRLTLKLDDMLGRSDNKKICLIVFLVIVLAVLLYFTIKS
mmetsp:Transcript_54729/g.67131  ORF Transcript_54729/g.67131 Transcript_54729/m.67131 type:complete len:251 (-) Transcript_54729:48-800(-)